MTLHRFFLPAGSVERDEVRFPEEAARQIRTVLRLRPGSRVVVLDGSGTEMVTRLVEVAGAVRGMVEERRENVAEPETRLRLYQGVLKGAKFELVLQKCTEVGVSEVVPVVSARSVPAEPGAARLRRYESILREAAEQSGRGTVPALHPPEPLQRALQEAAGDGLAIFLWEEERSIHLRNIQLLPGNRLSLFIGPEGGFTEEEAEGARRAGAQVATLGSRILRAETAAIVALTLVFGQLGELG